MATKKSRRVPRAAARKKTVAKRKTVKRSVAAARADRRQHRPETLRLRSIMPSLTVNDIEGSLRFYCDILGFIVAERFKNDRGALRGASLKAGVCDIALMQDDWARGRDRKKGEGLRIWLKTAQDVDAVAERIKASGARLTEEPTDQPWGVRSLAVDDPDGFHLTLYRER